MQSCILTPRGSLLWYNWTMKKIAGIYKITSPSGKVYVGQSWDIGKRWAYHQNRGHVLQTPLGNSFKKYSAANHRFEVLYELPSDLPNNTQYCLDIWEQFLMDESRLNGDILLNLREAGSTGNLSKETKAKLSASRRGKKLSDETRAKISASLTGKKYPFRKKGYVLSDAARRNIRASKQSNVTLYLGNTFGAGGKGRLGQPHSEETKQKISHANRGGKRPDLAVRNRLRKGQSFPRDAHGRFVSE